MRFLTIRPVQGRAKLRPTLLLAIIALVLLPAACRQQPVVPESNNGTAMHRANPARTGVYQTKGPTKYESIKWQFEADDWVFGAPAVANGTVYFTSYDGRVYAADAETGAEKWRVDTGTTIIASPAVSNGLVYVANMAGSLLALDARAGRNVGAWRRRLVIPAHPPLSTASFTSVAKAACWSRSTPIRAKNGGASRFPAR